MKKEVRLGRRHPHRHLHIHPDPDLILSLPSPSPRAGQRLLGCCVDVARAPLGTASSEGENEGEDKREGG